MPARRTSNSAAVATSVRRVQRVAGDARDVSAAAAAAEVGLFADKDIVAALAVVVERRIYVKVEEQERGREEKSARDLKTDCAFFEATIFLRVRREQWKSTLFSN